ncbi:MAG: 50S ribosomal protein L9 [Syntrophobacteraceae bacterium CG2_30_61_12]|nr:MAG: 50S ribosomal protein L9 [Syntrophobacteraceae bacterium CG2_30_61_12]PIU32663.1 MAG: 50S ribosomal protein L9 [Syntrophobacteraceae bacterium CG07_land_8_20_14_0_80_61_8]
MKVILTENMFNLGPIGKVVTVANGYARNFLLPKGLALEATGRNVKQLEHRKRLLEHKREQIRKEVMSIAEKLNEVQLTFQRKVVEEDKLYGSVSATDIHGELTTLGFDLDRRMIILDQPIKQLGEFKIKVRMDPEISSTIQVVVGKEA